MKGFSNNQIIQFIYIRFIYTAPNQNRKTSQGSWKKISFQLSSLVVVVYSSNMCSSFKNKAISKGPQTFWVDQWINIKAKLNVELMFKSQL